MFNNPFNRKYQNGGSVDDEGFYNWLKTNVKEFKDYSIDQIKEGVRKMEQTEEGRKASASLKKSYEEYKKSKPSAKSKFEDGGKFQDFICKHARGGSVDCGCGGMKVVRAAEGIDDIPTPKDSTVTDNGYVIYKPSIKEVAPNGESVIITYGHDPNGQWARRMEWANGGTSILGGYNNNGKWVSEGDATYDPTSEFAKAFLSPRVRMSKYKDRPQSRQEGGELTRKQALTGAQWAMGRGMSPVSRNTARFAYANAKNALRNNSNLRGSDLRQAAREMISRPPQAPIPEMAQIDFNALNTGINLPPIKNPEFINEPIFTDEELNSMSNEIVNDAIRNLPRNKGNNTIAGAVQHFSTIAPSTVGAVNYRGYQNVGQSFKDMWNHLRTTLFKK